MKVGRWVWVAVAAVATVVVVVAVSGGLVLARGAWLGQTVLDRPAAGISSACGVTGPGTTGYTREGDPGTGRWRGPGMMGYGRGGVPSGAGMACGGAYVGPGERGVSSLAEVEPAVHAYLEGFGYSGLEVSEVMEFEHNYYAIAVEADTGIGAMELLVDKGRGTVGPEPGPNIMWNARYGMMGRGWGRDAASGEMSISPLEAEAIAQRWLDANLPGRTAGEADVFYGYYTLHFLEGGDIEGMLSVHGTSGAVWFHNWHGGFVAMVEGHG